ncbi:ABC transporter substrate-binding protein [Mesorhizobium sp. M1217]|uniref:ABC transporter substrate-binding protein n=2 Tax=unclassified Mesorhizobium TaxID=325217 RepID=UPI00333678FB
MPKGELVMTTDYQAPFAAFKLDRRTFLKAAALTAGGGAVVSFGPAHADDVTPLRIQYDWLIGNGQLGDIVAQQKGFFRDEGLEVTFGPGGPNAQTVPPVLAGQAQLGQLSSTAQFFTAFEAGRPLMLFACGFRYSPYAYVSLPAKPIRTPQDFIGKTVAINPNGRYLLDLIMAKNGLDRSKVNVVTMGADMTPLVAGQVDAVTGFLTNTKALSILGPDIVTLLPAKTGVPNYANAYFTAADAFEPQKQNLAKFLRAVARGWGWAFENRRAAVDILCDAYPAIDREIEYKTVDLIMSLAFDEMTKEKGWGWHEREKLSTQIDLFKEIGKFPGKVPVVDDCVTWEILEMTADIRPKLG